MIYIQKVLKKQWTASKNIKNGIQHSVVKVIILALGGWFDVMV